MNDNTIQILVRNLYLPKKKLVPFTFDSFPRGAWIRVSIASGVKDFFVQDIANADIMIGKTRYTYKWLYSNAKLLVIENGRVAGEKPCGLEVEE